MGKRLGVIGEPRNDLKSDHAVGQKSGSNVRYKV